jgi:DNA-binding response OmpR family regulator
MNKHRLLILEDDPDISNMLRIYFTSQEYEVETAKRGAEALEKTRQKMPHLIVLDIMLPDMDGYEVCRALRTNNRTSYIPVIFLTQRDERSDKIQGLELGADDYITKPFDIEELRLRVHNAIARTERESLTDPHTNLPTGRLIEDQLRKVIRETGWSLLDIRLNHLEDFKEVYGFVAGDNVLRYTAMLIGEVVDAYGTSNDFIGHPGNDNFIVITQENLAFDLQEQLKLRFAKEIQTHYSYLDRQQGYIKISSNGSTPRTSPFMTLAIGIVSPAQYQFADIREITEIAAETRRKDNEQK